MIGLVIKKKFPQRKAQAKMASLVNSTKRKNEYQSSIFHKLFQKTEKGKLHNSFYEIIITLIPKAKIPQENTTIEKYPPAKS